MKDTAHFVHWFRSAAPYIHGFRNKTFVIAFGGELVSDGGFVQLAHDVNLLNSLGVRLVLVHGVRPQVEARLTENGATIRYVSGLRVTDDAALACVKEAAGTVRVEIEALLSLGVANTPMAGADIRVASGNFVTAKPIGVIEGVDLLHTGEVRKIDAAAIRRRLDQHDIVLLSPIGYSPTGEIFNLSLEDVATQAAVELAADKLIFLMDTEGVPGKGRTIRSALTVSEARQMLEQNRKLPEDVGYYLPCTVAACTQGVKRAHLISRKRDGALLSELFTRDGVGTMVSPTPLETLRPASIDDVGGILGLIEPLEREGILVRRSRELLEMEIERFLILESDGVVAGCAALYPFPEEQAAELACLAVSQEFRGRGFGDLLLAAAEKNGKKAGFKRLFVLTTRTEHWFEERGFVDSSPDRLPQRKQALYNYKRKSKVLEKQL
ncbi:MAG: amino-acid N-acetyltransferase [Hydrogenophilales bacterium 16-64-46]|nr:MAG: amino-acid N-acetyltransferase [Hydrogenophilales bacterium 12-64-13]OYZ06625.1 MAG: amino-acid N-acetyltransferase [Hydrogenophilales bacterium 16-64-46]OZA39333.1 MAG: amino-acid N-acetyltransferase [Hydrogenophilales bacterium 17-64-34]HQS98895.1 amino-acid N-acetyltransferase [Thiobacillus sp.]